MASLATANNALKDVYICIIKEQLNNRNKILSNIKQTTSDVWGKMIIVCDYENQTETKKELQNIYCDIGITDKAIRCCEMVSGAFVNLLNEECENAIRVGINNQLILLCKEIRKDCEINAADIEILNFLNSQDSEFIQDNITMHKLCDWEWVENEDGKVLYLMTGKPLYTAKLAKYCNFIFTQHFKNIIKERFKKDGANG